MHDVVKNTVYLYILFQILIKNTAYKGTKSKIYDLKLPSIIACPKKDQKQNINYSCKETIPVAAKKDLNLLSLQMSTVKDKNVAVEQKAFN